MYAHGSGHLTRDLDICYERSPGNIERLVEALKPYHPRLRAVPADVPFCFDAETLTRGLNFTLATDLGDIDLFGEVPGIGPYQSLRALSSGLELFGRPCNVLTLDGLIQSKRVSGRPRDIAALPELEALRELTREVRGERADEHSEYQDQRRSLFPDKVSAFPKLTTALVERQEPVARLMINRPPLNILDLGTIRELNSQLSTVLNEADVRLVEIRGAGENAFSAGVEIRDHFPDRAAEMLREFHALIRAVIYAKRPVLAVVRGHCLGGGMELALACDFAVASEDARFGQPEIKVGAFPPVAAVLLPRLIPEKRAMEMILTGESITAGEAHRMGLVNRVVPPSELEQEVEKFSAALLAQSSKVTSVARKATRLGLRGSFEAALRESERIYLEELLPTEDAVEGLRAFLEKRTPRWKGK